MRAKARGVGLTGSAFVSFLFFIAVTCAMAVHAAAQQSASGSAITSDSVSNTIHRSWQIGGFAAGGFPPYYSVHSPTAHYQEELLFYSAGMEVGHMVTAMHGPNFLRGRGEVVAEVIPYWHVNHPAQTVRVYLANSTQSFLAGVGEYSLQGASISPVEFRWNFMKKDSSRFVPWIQAGMGLLWTDNEFPQGYGSPEHPPVAKTSRVNFTPQVDFGENIFTRKNQSLSLGVRATHITDFGFTAYDPGVNVVAEFRVAYSWWK